LGFSVFFDFWDVSRETLVEKMELLISRFGGDFGRFLGSAMDCLDNLELALSAVFWRKIGQNGLIWGVFG